MAQKVYGITLEQASEQGLNADEITYLSDEEKRRLIDEYRLYDDEMSTLDSFFYYLNADKIDTENRYWFIY